MRTSAKFLALKPGCLILAAAALSWSMGREPVRLEPIVLAPQAALSFKILPLSASSGVALWAEQGSEGTSVLHGRVVSSTPDSTNGRAVLVESISRDDGWDAAPDSEGGQVIVWETHGRISAQRFAKNWAPQWKTAVSVNSASSVGARPRVLWDGAAGWYVIWQETLSPTEQPLLLRRFGLDGSPLWVGEGLRVSTLASCQERVHLVSGGMANVIVAWKDTHAGASEIRAQQVNADGRRVWGEEGLAITAPAGLEEMPRVASAGAGAAAFAWTTFPGGVHHTIIQQVGSSGRFAWPSNGLDIAPGNWGAWNPHAAGHTEEGFWVGWEDYRDERRWQLRLRHWSASGKSLWASEGVLLAPANADQSDLALAVADHAAVWAAWRDDRSTHPGVYAQKVDAQGRLLKGFLGLTVADRLARPSSPVVAALPGGGAAVAFTDTASPGHCSLYVQILGD